jgi:RNA polymerase sigma factor (TIGR02999 family)
MESAAGDITVLLRQWKEGDAKACDQLMSHVYPHLHDVAAAYLRRESEGHTLQPTALVHELYLRLLQQRKPDWEDRAHFYAFAAQVMRRILTDHARASHAGKRGAGQPHVPLSDEIPWINLNSEDVLDLNRALDELECVDPRKVRLVELRYFLGCTLPEASAMLSISSATAERDLTMARTWLYSKLAARMRDSSPELRDP